MAENFSLLGKATKPKLKNSVRSSKSSMLRQRFIKKKKKKTAFFTLKNYNLKLNKTYHFPKTSFKVYTFESSKAKKNPIKQHRGGK